MNKIIKIDTNIYWLPEELFTDDVLYDEFSRCVPREYGMNIEKYDLEDGRKAIKVEKPYGCENLNYFQGDYTLEKQLHDMDEGGIDYAIMKLPGCQEWLSLEMCKKLNTMAYEFSAKSKGRLQPLAIVPPFGSKESLKELSRCVNELGMKGVQISAHYGNYYLDHALFRKFFEYVNELKIPVYVHHTPVPVDYTSLLDYSNLRRSFGRCQDQITAIARELYSGMFETLPNVKMIHSMLGGAYYAFKDMLIPHGSGGGRFDTSDSENIRKYLKNNIYFEMSHAQPWGKEGLEMAAKVLGADHILYGSSYPVKLEWMLNGVAMVNSLDLPQEDINKMVSENAQLLYGVLK